MCLRWLDYSSDPLLDRRSIRRDIRVSTAKLRASDVHDRPMILEAALDAAFKSPGENMLPIPTLERAPLGPCFEHVLKFLRINWLDQ
jgi:hypothetical protein